MNYKNAYIGNEDQLMTVLDSKLCQGRQEGVRAIHVENGADLSVTILPDRGMDIFQIRYKGKNMNYIAPCGIVAPEYYNDRGLEWLRSAYFGFLTTLGLQHMGGPKGEHGLHGKAANAPAENVTVERGIEKGKPVVTVKGTMREAKCFGESLRLTRELKFFYEENKMEMTDTIENYGFRKTDYVLGYHINWGWPLLCETTKAEVSHTAVKPRNDYAAQFPKSEETVQAPQEPFPERCYIYDTKADKSGNAYYTIKNAKAGIGAKVTFKQKDFPKLLQWQLFSKGEYVMGLEPLVCEMDGPLVGEKGNPCPKLAPGAKKSYKLTFEFTDK